MTSVDCVALWGIHCGSRKELRMVSLSLRWRRARLVLPFLLAAAAAGSRGDRVRGPIHDPGFSPFFRVGGRVAHPRTYRLADLEALFPAHTVNVLVPGPGRHRNPIRSPARCCTTSLTPRRRASTPAARTTLCAGRLASTPPTTTRWSWPGANSIRASRPSRCCWRTRTMARC